jgi:hypothetical protein
VVEEESGLGTVPSVRLVVLVKFDFEVYLHEIIITASYKL